MPDSRYGSTAAGARPSSTSIDRYTLAGYQRNRTHGSHATCTEVPGGIAGPDHTRTPTT